MATTNDNTGDFKDKQFQKEEVADKVVEQYDEERARIFYKHVMVSVPRFHRPAAMTTDHRHLLTS
jgi:hypothetical protein